MPINDEHRVTKMPQNVIIEDRKKITVSGVESVDSFDEQTVILYTDMGQMTVRGKDLKIGKLNTETGELCISGTFFALAYTDDRQKGGVLSRLFK